MPDLESLIINAVIDVLLKSAAKMIRRYTPALFKKLRSVFNSRSVNQRRVEDENPQEGFDS
jgi:hypothetical protein